MKASLRKHNFTFGDEKVDYTSDYMSGYGSLPHEAYLYKHKNKEGIRAVIEVSFSIDSLLYCDLVPPLSIDENLILPFR